MRKVVSLVAILIMAATLFIPTALALEQYEPLPADVIHDTDRLEIRKIYELAASINPADIPREDFERDGVRYTCTDILREVVIGDEVRTHTEAETIESASNDIDSVISLLPKEKDFFTDDGFFGVLYLDTSSIKSEVSGYGSRTRTKTITRSYPNLSDSDTQYIPKTVNDSGKTYTLEDVQWQTDNTYNVDDYEIGNRYTAVATYSGTATSSYVRGYTISANYTGDICRSGISIIRYTVIFTGTAVQATELEPPASPELETTLKSPEPESQSESDPESAQPVELTPDAKSEKPIEFDWLLVLLPLLGLMIGGSGVYFYLTKLKEQRNNETDNNYNYTNTYTDDNDSDPGTGR